MSEIILEQSYLLIGAPNCGKTALFNSLTGSKQKTANHPGITVETKHAHYLKGDKKISIYDLPGLYSLDALSLDERISRDFILQKESSHLSIFSEDARYHHHLLLVVDSTRLQKSLYLAMELKKLSIPFTLILNINDEAIKRGQKLNTDALEQFFGTKVFETSAYDPTSVSKLKDYLSEAKTKNEKRSFELPQNKVQWAKEIFQEIDLLLKKIVISPIKPDKISKRIDSYLTHPFWGLLIFTFLLVIVFEALFSWAGPLQDMIETFFGAIGEFVTQYVHSPMLQSFLVDGLIGGVGGVIVFLPQILILFLFIFILEDTGYMSRVAFVLDMSMKKLGLPGKAIIPLLSSHACAIPGIMSARTLESEKDRLITILISPLMVCSARLPVYALLIAAMVPTDRVWGIFNQQSLILLALYLLGILTGLLVAFVARKKVMRSPVNHLLIELPPYRLPRVKNLVLNLADRAKAFLTRAGTIILGLTIMLWALTYFPLQENYDIKNSYAGKIGQTIEPVFAPLGFDWKITTALIPSFAAREVMVASLGTVLSIEDSESDQGLDQIKNIIQHSYPVQTIISLLIWFAFAPQCLATIAVIKRETGSYRLPMIVFAYTLALAYVGALIPQFF
jgi:ferrous iron transport protein B